MSGSGGLLRLAPSAALKQRRLRERLAGRDETQLAEVVEDAQIMGSLQLAGCLVSWEEVRASRRGDPAPDQIAALRRASGLVPREAALSVDALLAWQAAVCGGPRGFRGSPRAREGTAPAPPALIRGRLELLQEWVASESAARLKPGEIGALVLARVMEVLPFETANGRVSRLAASHVMVRAGARPPILVGADAARLQRALEAAFRFETAELTTLLEEASERALDVMLQALERGEA